MTALSNMDSSTDETMKVKDIKYFVERKMLGSQERLMVIKIFTQRLKNIGKRAFVLIYLFVFITLTNLFGLLCFLFL